MQSDHRKASAMEYARDLAVERAIQTSISKNVGAFELISLLRSESVGWDMSISNDRKPLGFRGAILTLMLRILQGWPLRRVFRVETQCRAFLMSKEGRSIK